MFLLWFLLWFICGIWWRGSLLTGREKIVKTKRSIFKINMLSQLLLPQSLTQWCQTFSLSWSTLPHSSGPSFRRVGRWCSRGVRHCWLLSRRDVHSFPCPPRSIARFQGGARGASSGNFLAWRSRLNSRTNLGISTTHWWGSWLKKGRGYIHVWGLDRLRLFFRMMFGLEEGGQKTFHFRFEVLRYRQCL